MNRRISPTEEIGGRMLTLPRDVMGIIDSMGDLRLRRLSEEYLKRYIFNFLNSEILNSRVIIDKLTDYFRQKLGSTLDEYLDKYYYYTRHRSTPDRPLETIRIPFHPDLPYSFYHGIARILTPSWSWVDQFATIISRFDSNVIEKYIVELFNSAGYFGETMIDVMYDYNIKNGLAQVGETWFMPQY